jgi:hypothetical protein
VSASLDDIQVLTCRGDSAAERFKIHRFRTMYLGTDDEKLRLLDDNEIDGPLCKIEGPRPIAEAEHQGATISRSLWSDLRIISQNAG